MQQPVFMVCAGDDTHNRDAYIENILKFHSRRNFYAANGVQGAAKLLTQRQSVILSVTAEEFERDREDITKLVNSFRGKVVSRLVIFGQIAQPISEADGFGKDVVYWRQKYAKAAAA